MKEDRTKGPRKILRKTEDYRRTFESASGDRVLQDLMDVHFVLRSAHHSDAHMAAFQEGQRDVVLRILKILKTDTARMKRHIEEIQKHANE